MEIIFLVLLGCLALALMAGFVCTYESFRGPSEVLYFDKAKTFNGYALFGAGYLIDMEGNLINKWPGAGRLLDNGHMISRLGLEEWDWDGNLVWKYDQNRENYHPHHDAIRTFNPKLKEYTTIILANKDLTHDQVIAAGADPAWKKSYDDSQMDALVEVDMKGNVVWKGWFFDHLVQDKFQDKANYTGKDKGISDYPGKLEINWGKPVAQDWMHCNSLDHNRELDLVAGSSVHGEFFRG